MKTPERRDISIENSEQVNPVPYNVRKSALFFKPSDAQPAIICSKLTIETLEQGVTYFQS